MSTRSSNYYANDLHLYVEQNYGEVCLSFPVSIKANYESKEYGDFTMPDEAWLEFAEDIIKAVAEAKGFK